MGDQTDEKAPLPVRVMVVDDHAAVRHGLFSLLQVQRGVEPVAQASDGVQAITLAPQVEPEVILMDSSMPRMDGVEATRAILANQPHVAVIGLAMYESAGQAICNAGASAYVVKGTPSDELIEAIFKHGRRPNA